MRSLLAVPALPLVAALLGAPCSAQITPGNAVVLTGLPGFQKSGLLDVSLSTGTFVPIGRFRTDVYPPLECAWDPVGGDVVVALALTPSSSRIVRLGLRGTTVVRERILADLPELVTGLVIGVEGDLFAATGGARGAIYRIARNGGPPSLARVWADTTAMWTWRMSSHAWVTHPVSGSAPVVTLLELTTGSIAQGPFSMTGLTGVVPTDLIDLPTGLSRELISDTQGRLHLLEGFTSVRSLALQPPLPAGGSVAMVAAGPTQLLVLGGAAHPHIVAVDPLGGGAWQQIAGPFPGDPVDFDVADPAGPGIVWFGSTCAAPGSGGFGASGLPRIGSASFQLTTSGLAPSAPAHLVIGLSDQQYAGVPLPFSLPGNGCPLLASMEVVITATTDPNGFAAVTLPIPNVASLNGVVVYGQWLQGAIAALGSSSAAAVHIGL